MCGRFYIDDDTAREIEKTIRKVDEQLRGVRRTGDIHPTETASVIAARGQDLLLTEKRWGFPGFGNTGLIINARAESVLEKRMFRESVLSRRLVIPAAGFYEWNHEKEKVKFSAEDAKREELSGLTSGEAEVPQKSILYLAGIYGHFEGEDRFVILTTAANSSMKDVHDRMPLIFGEEAMREWLLNGTRTEELLHTVPDPLKKRVEYEQQKLNFSG